MKAFLKISLCALPLCALTLTTALLSAQVPPEITTSEQAIAAIYHAEGAQLYECSTSPDGMLVWESREPIATLISDGSTVGRHYAGPRWEHDDGSALRAKAVSSAPGATQNDIPWLKLAVVNHRGEGVFSRVTKVQRINTHGGVALGVCDEIGQFKSVPYSADYVFLRKD